MNELHVCTTCGTELQEHESYYFDAEDNIFCEGCWDLTDEHPSDFQ